MGRCRSEYAKALRAAYEEEIWEARSSIRKNFEDMDFENATNREKAELIIEGMEDSCRKLAEQIGEYSIG